MLRVSVDPIPRRVTDSSETQCRLTSPAQGAGQLAAQESASNDGDGLQLSGNFLKSFEILDLCKNVRRKIKGQSYGGGKWKYGTVVFWL